MANSEDVLECPPDFAIVHTTLARLPSKEANDWDATILPLARRLIQRYPPLRLQYLSQNYLSVHSVVNMYDKTLFTLDWKNPIDTNKLLPTDNGSCHPLDHPDGKRKLGSKDLWRVAITTNPLTNLSITSKSVKALARQYQKPLLISTLFVSTLLSAYALFWYSNRIYG